MKWKYTIRYVNDGELIVEGEAHTRRACEAAIVLSGECNQRKDGFFSATNGRQCYVTIYGGKPDRTLIGNPRFYQVFNR